MLKLGPAFAGLSIILLAVACGSGESTTEEVTTSCDAIRDIKSYRYSINLKLQSPAFDASQASPTPPPPLSAFADALQALFSDLELEGAYVAPDKSQAVMQFENEELELREVGDKSWIRVGNVWSEDSGNDEGSTLTPEVVCRDIVEEIVTTLEADDAERETVNGIETDYYLLTETDLKRLPELLGGPETDLPDKFGVEVWLAREQRYPVKLSIGAEDTDEQGKPIGLSLFMEFRDIDDPGIRIEPPVGSPPRG